MDAVLTLIAAPAAGLEPAAVLAVRKAMGRIGLECGAPDWLAPEHACDLPFRGAPDQADAAARLALGPQPIDVVAQPTEGRRKRLLLADMESTVIRQELLDELGDIAGLGERIATITHRTMNGELDFRQSLRARTELLAGLGESAFAAAEERIEVTPGALALVRTMKAAGAWCMLVSGGFRRFTRRVGALCGFDEEVGNEPELVDGRLTGGIAEPLIDAEAKAERLVRAAARLHIPIRAALAIGDGANDLPMLEIAGLGLAFHGKPAVAAQARWRLDHADLTGALYAQGYRAAEIAA